MSSAGDQESPMWWAGRSLNELCGRPGIANVMSRTQFEMILRGFHVEDDFVEEKNMASERTHKPHRSRQMPSIMRTPSEHFAKHFSPNQTPLQSSQSARCTSSLSWDMFENCVVNIGLKRRSKRPRLAFKAAAGSAVLDTILCRGLQCLMLKNQAQLEINCASLQPEHLPLSKKNFRRSENG